MEKYKIITKIFEADNNIPPMDDYTAKQVQLLLGKSYYMISEYKKAYDAFSVWRLNDLSHNDLLIMVKKAL